MSEIDILRARFRETGAASGAGHLGEDQWERLACDEMPLEEKENALDHIVECPLCSDTFRAVQILRSEASTFDEDAPVLTVVAGDADVRRLPLRTFGWLALAAVIVVAVALPLRQTSGPSIGDGATIVRSAGSGKQMTVIFPVGEIEWSEGQDVVMEWTAVDPATPAIVEILDAEGEPVWTGPKVESTHVTWPGEVIPGAGRYYWRVMAGDPAAEVADSELVSFDLSGPDLSANHP